MTETGWVPLALSQDIVPGTAAGAIAGGAEIALWRDSAGQAHAWEDRCPHRGMKMSFGFVRKDRLTCLYHGWEYDAEGRCRYIPAHPELEVPDTICVTRYPVAEAAGLVWAHLPLGAPAGEPPADIEATPVRSLFLDVPLDAALATLAEEGPAARTGAHLTLDTAHGRLGIGLQAIGPAASALHVTALGRADAAARLALCDWAEALRRRAETAIRAGRAAA
jgi:nitrite reductase/ring-hydroxylating ferredoxin subunit